MSDVLEIVEWGFDPSIRSMYEIIPFYHHDIGKVTALFAFLAQHELNRSQQRREFVEVMASQQRYRLFMKLGGYSGHIYKKTAMISDSEYDLGSWHALMKSYLDQITEGLPSITSPTMGTGYRASDLIRACVDYLAVFLLEVTTFANLFRLGATDIAIYEEIVLWPAVEVEQIMHNFLENSGYRIQLTRFTYITQTFSFTVGAPDNPQIEHIAFVPN